MRSNESILYRHLKFVTSLKQAMDTVIQGESAESIRKHAGCSQFARKYTQLLAAIGKDLELPDIFDSYTTIPRPTQLTPTNRQDLFEGVYANVCMLESFLETEISADGDEIFELRDFFHSRLRSAVSDLPKTEKDVQNALEAMLIGRGMQKGQDYDRETGRVKVSGKESVPDFIIPRSSLAIEVKFAGRGYRVGQIVDEMNADIAAYSRGYRHLMFIVYDVGNIQNEAEFRKDLESVPNVSVIVIKH